MTRWLRRLFRRPPTPADCIRAANGVGTVHVVPAGSITEVPAALAPEPGWERGSGAPPRSPCPPVRILSWDKYAALPEDAS